MTSNNYVLTPLLCLISFTWGVFIGYAPVANYFSAQAKQGTIGEFAWIVKEDKGKQTLVISTSGNKEGGIRINSNGRGQPPSDVFVIGSFGQNVTLEDRNKDGVYDRLTVQGPAQGIDSPAIYTDVDGDGNPEMKIEHTQKNVPKLLQIRISDHWYSVVNRGQSQGVELDGVFTPIEKTEDGFQFKKS